MRITYSPINNVPSKWANYSKSWSGSRQHIIPGGGLIGFTSSTSAAQDFSTLDPRISAALKKLNKKEAVTKQKVGTEAPPPPDEHAVLGQSLLNMDSGEEISQANTWCIKF